MDVKVIVFHCNWSVYPWLQLSKLSTETKKPFKTIVTMCSGRIDPILILEAFSKGAWGVLVTGCPPEECEHDGNYKARRRILLLKKLLEQFNIEPQRLRWESVAVGEQAKLQQMINSFVDEITKLGPVGETEIEKFRK